MSIIKKLTSVGASVITLVLPAMAGAVPDPFGQAQKDLGIIGQQSGVAGSNNLPAMIGNIINAVLGFMGIILLGYLLYAGFLWMTSGGEDKKVGQAKTMIRNAIVGLIIIVASVAISNFVLDSLVKVARQ